MIFIDYTVGTSSVSDPDGSGTFSWIRNQAKIKKTDLIKIIFRFNSTEKTVECSFKSDRIDWFFFLIDFNW